MRNTSGFKYGCDWFLKFHAAVFRAVGALDLYSENATRLLKELMLQVLNFSGRGYVAEGGIGGLWISSQELIESRKKISRKGSETSLF